MFECQATVDLDVDVDFDFVQGSVFLFRLR